MSATEIPEPPLWVIVLIDSQNVYNCAREAFDLYGEGHVGGNIDPLKLALHVAERPDPTSGKERRLQAVRAYRGRPDNARDPRTYSAWRSQTAEWAQRGGDRFTGCYRDLRYSPEGVREKGIDVWLAVDLARFAVKQDCDRIVVVSSDTDLVPALELSVEERGAEFVEVAGWTGPHKSAALLTLEDQRVHQWRLDRAAYDRVHDPTDYNTPKRYRKPSDWDAQISAEGRRPRRP